MKGKRFLSLLLCLVMVLGLLPTSVFADSESSLGADDVYKLQILTYSEKNGSVRPTPQLMDRAKSSVTLKRWDTDENRIKEEKLPLTGYNGTATGKVMKDPNYKVSMTIYPAAGYKFADTDSVRLYIGAGATFNPTDCCKYETKVNDDGSRTYTFQYTEEIGKAVATLSNGALFFLFSFVPLDETDVYKLQILTYSEKNGKVAPTTQLMDRARSSVTLKRWDTDTKSIKEETLPLTGYNGTATGKVMKDPNYTVSMTIYPAAGYKFADTNSVWLYIGAGATFNATNCCHYETKVNSDGSRTYTFKYTEEIGEAVTTVKNGALFFLFSFEEGESTQLGENDVYHLTTSDVAAQETKGATSYLDKAKSTATVSYWKRRATSNPVEETLTLANVEGLNLMRNTDYEVSLLVKPVDGYRFAEGIAVEAKICDPNAKLSAVPDGAINLTYVEEADGSRTYKYKYTKALGAALDAKGTTADGVNLCLIFSFEKDKKEELTENDVYHLTTSDVAAQESKGTTSYLDKAKSTATVSYGRNESASPDAGAVG